jgi:hypothetical protein
MVSMADDGERGRCRDFIDALFDHAHVGRTFGEGKNSRAR